MHDSCFYSCMEPHSYFIQAKRSRWGRKMELQHFGEETISATMLFSMTADYPLVPTCIPFNQDACYLMSLPTFDDPIQWACHSRTIEQPLVRLSSSCRFGWAADFVSFGSQSSLRQSPKCHICRARTRFNWNVQLRCVYCRIFHILKFSNWTIRSNSSTRGPFIKAYHQRRMCDNGEVGTGPSLPWHVPMGVNSMVGFLS